MARAEIEMALDAERQAEANGLAQLKAIKAETVFALAMAERFQKAPWL